MTVSQSDPTKNTASESDYYYLQLICSPFIKYLYFKTFGRHRHRYPEQENERERESDKTQVKERAPIF